MTIKDVEKKLNISRANIIFYEKQGLILPKRNDNEYRNFNEDDLKRLKQIIIFRRCNISIDDIKAIFNGKKSLNEISKEKMLEIDNMIKELNGAKKICEKLSLEKNDLLSIDEDEYLDLIHKEEKNGNKFYDITEDFILSEEKLYQSIIESKKFKGGDKVKKGLKLFIYISSALLLFGFIILFDFLFDKSIDWINAMGVTFIFTSIDIIGVRAYINKRENRKPTSKENRKFFLILLLIFVGLLSLWYGFQYFYVNTNKVNENILELSTSKYLINIAEEKYRKDNADLRYAEGHKILSYEIKDNKIYAYIATIYGVFKNDNGKCISVSSNAKTITLIFNKDKNNEGIYTLLEYIEDEIPNNLKDKVNISYSDNFYTKQLDLYCS